jgi:hypothetical protein
LTGAGMPGAADLFPDPGSANLTLNAASWRVSFGAESSDVSIVICETTRRLWPASDEDVCLSETTTVPDSHVDREPRPR